jgi:hypothetical protein
MSFHIDRVQKSHLRLFSLDKFYPKVHCKLLQMTYFSDHFPIIFSSDVVFAMTSSRILKAWWTIGRKNIWRNRNSSHSDVTAVKSLSVRFLLWKTTPLGKTCLLCITIHNTNVSCLILHIKQNTKQCFNQIKHWFLQSKHTVIPQIQTQSNSSNPNTKQFLTSKVLFETQINS